MKSIITFKKIVTELYSNHLNVKLFYDKRKNCPNHSLKKKEESCSCKIALVTCDACPMHYLVSGNLFTLDFFG